jgi:serine phosphatase RsbU (regulator of sigma subunit)
MSDSLEAPSLRALVGHREFVRADDTLDTVHQRFAGGRHDFFAVLSGRDLLGLCARRDLGTLLGARYGFALYGRARVGDHLTPHTIRAGADDPMTDVLHAVAQRRDEHFFDDVLLVDRHGEFLGLIPVRELVRVQHVLLRVHLAELERRQTEIAERNRRMEEDLRMAREVQTALLPRDLPDCRSESGRVLRLAPLFRPADGVSGDFFDVMPSGDGAATLLVCDVMGHGVRSALVTAMVRTLLEELRSQAADPAAVLTRLNASLSRLLERTGDLIFVTAVAIRVDAGARRLTAAHAGHPFPFLRNARHRRVRPLAELAGVAGPALGLVADHVYSSVETGIEEGDRVVLVTDGVLEARDAAGEEFGAERLATALAAGADRPLAAMLGDVVAAAAAHAGSDRFDDDVCLLGCELHGPR